jgi:CRISPR/Cas system-associated exonuclease Cas4 (RecB family)
LKEDPVAAGKFLQLPVYALAAEQGYPGADITASYWFVIDRDSTLQHLPIPLTQETRERFRAVIGRITDGIEDGVFPGNPGDEDWHSWRNCKICPYERVCPTERDEIWERIALSDEVAPYRGLQA